MFKKLITRPIAVFTILVAALVLGGSVMTKLPVSLVPEVDIPMITVKVTEPDLSARAINEMVINPLRLQLMQVSHLSKIEAKAKDGSGLLTMNFEYGANMDLLFVEVNEKIDRAVEALPRSVERPKVMRASATDLPAFYLNVSLKTLPLGKNGEMQPYGNKNFAQLSDFVNDVIARRVEQIPQVAMVDPSGFVSTEIFIAPNKEKMRMAGVREEVLTEALSGANVSLGNLTIRDGEYSFNVRFESKLIDKTDIENIYIKTENQVFQIKDLADVSYRTAERLGEVVSDGEEAITMAVIKRSEARMSDLKAHINEQMESFEKDYPDLEFKLTRDQTSLLDYSINSLISNIIIGTLLACLVIFLFMQNFRTPLIVVFTMPTALIVSFLFFHLAGLSINIISLAGMVIGIGMMTDNSIVAVDNITYRWKKGLPLVDACAEGIKEVIWPMFSAVLTTCAVFIPLVFLSGIAGALFYDQAISVAIILLTSLLITALVLPTLYYVLYRKKESPEDNKYLKKYLNFDMTSLYEKILKWNFRRRWVMWGMFALSIVGIALVYGQIKKEQLPTMSYNDMMVNIEWNEKVSAQENTRRCEELIRACHAESSGCHAEFISASKGQTLKQVQGDSLIQEYTIMSGVHQFIMAHTREQGISEAGIYIKTSSFEDVAEVQSKIRESVAARHPEANVEFEASANLFDMIFSSNEAVLRVNIRPLDGSIQNLGELNELLDNIRNNIRSSLPNAYIPAAQWQEHIEYVAIPEMMSIYGVSYKEVLDELEKALAGQNVMNISSGSRNIPIVIGGEKQALSEVVYNTRLEKFVDGEVVAIPLNILLKETMAQDLKTISSGGDGEFYPIDMQLDDTEVLKAIEIIKTEVDKNNNFEVDFAGSYYSDRGMVKELVYVLIIAILLLYFILAAQFESLVQPLIILFELLIDIFAAVAVMLIIGVSLNLMSLIGIVVMSGIVINDSILKLDTINNLRKEGYNLKRAIMEAGARRLKPILMTSITTIFSMLPFLITGDMGSDLQYPLAVAVIAGMLAGTLVSIFYVPLVYYEIYKRVGKV